GRTDRTTRPGVARPAEGLRRATRDTARAAAVATSARATPRTEGRLPTGRRQRGPPNRQRLVRGRSDTRAAWPTRGRRAARAALPARRRPAQAALPTRRGSGRTASAGGNPWGGQPTGPAAARGRNTGARPSGPRRHPREAEAAAPPAAAHPRPPAPGPDRRTHGGQRSRRRGRARRRPHGTVRTARAARH